MISAPADAPLLQAQNVVAGYGRREILHGINLSLHAGEFVGLAGPNGSGKTTLLHCLTGHHPVLSGDVRLGGVDIRKVSRPGIARQISFVPQFTESVYGFGVREIILMGRFPYGGIGLVQSAKDAALADAALEKMHVHHLRDRSFNQLSGGEKQLVLLARAIVQDAPILLMDEPLTGLDLRHQFQVMEALRNLSKRPGGAAVATFHDLPSAARWCDRIVLLKHGHIQADGTPRQVVTSDLLRQVYNVEATITFEGDDTLHLKVHGAP